MRSSNQALPMVLASIWADHRQLALTRIVRWAVLLLCLAASTRGLRAQIAGERAIQGQVTGPSGAVIPKATITAGENSTG